MVPVLKRIPLATPEALVKAKTSVALRFTTLREPAIIAASNPETVLPLTLTLLATEGSTTPPTLNPKVPTFLISLFFISATELWRTINPARTVLPSILTLESATETVSTMAPPDIPKTPPLNT
jgi:hypothetical protein